MNTSFMVIPEKTCSLLRSSSNCNFSLYSPRMISWEREHGDGKVQFYSGEEVVGYDKRGKPQWKKINYDAKEELCKVGKELLKNSLSLLNKKHTKQDKFLSAMKEQGINIFKFIAKTTSPFITGLGSGHPTETGMILDRNIGVPYIPASSIKGVMRLACAINIAKTNGVNFVNENDELLKQYFGSVTQNEKQQKRGELLFLDAYPLNVPELKLDIMNPHYTKYYNSENKQPVETESPVPIKFLSVATGTYFVFRCMYMPLKNNTCDDDFVKQIFTTAFEQVGFGGKTSIGYGRFKELP